MPEKKYQSGWRALLVTIALIGVIALVLACVVAIAMRAFLRW